MFRGGELQGVAFVIVPGTQVNRVTFAAAFGHPHDVDEESDAFFGFRGKKLQVPQVSDVSYGFDLHANRKYIPALAGMS